MGSPTYTPIATVTLTGSDSEVIFSSIPASNRDLVVVINGSNSTTNSPSLRFNGDTAENYSTMRLYDNGSSVLGQAFTATYASIGIMQNAQTTAIAQIMDYSSITNHKTVISRGGDVGLTNRTEVTRWANTAAITSVSVRFDGGASYNAGTIISIYAIAG